MSASHGDSAVREAADSWGGEKGAQHSGGGVGSGHGHPTGPQKAAPSARAGRRVHTGPEGRLRRLRAQVPFHTPFLGAGAPGQPVRTSPLYPGRAAHVQGPARAALTSPAPSAALCPVPDAPLRRPVGTRGAGTCLIEPPLHRAGLACSPPLQRKARGLLAEQGLRASSTAPPVWAQPFLRPEQKVSGRPPQLPRGWKMGHRSPFASGQLPGFTRPAGCQEKVSQRAGHWPLGPKHAQGTSAPQLLSVPRRRRSRDPHGARGPHRFPRHHPGSPTQAGPPRAPRTALLGPRGRVPALSTSLTPANQKLICIMGHAPSPPQGTPRTALAAQRRAIHRKSLDRLLGVWTGHQGRGREGQRADSQGPFRKPPRRMGGTPAWGSPGEGRLGGLVLLRRPSLDPARKAGPSWAGALERPIHQKPSREAWGQVGQAHRPPGPEGLPLGGSCCNYVIRRPARLRSQPWEKPIVHSAGLEDTVILKDRDAFVGGGVWGTNLVIKRFTERT